MKWAILRLWGGICQFLSIFSSQKIWRKLSLSCNFACKIIVNTALIL